MKEMRKLMKKDHSIDNLMQSIVRHLERDYNPKKIIFFGSWVYGQPNKDSDIDFLIIKNTHKNPMERWMEVRKILRKLNKNIPLSPLIYTEKEIKERLKIKDFFIKEVLEKGKLIYG